MLYRQEANKSDIIERKVDNVIAEGKTPFQDYLFFNSEEHGFCISLDGDIQSCESDEGIYHEALVHPALLSHPNPKTVLIMGGGEGATAREVLKHKSVKKVVMVDIDEKFVELCNVHINSWADGAFEDERLEVIYEDINVYLKNTKEKFDVVIGDLVDVDDWESEVSSLYKESFYKQLKKSLKKDAVIATQAGALDIKSSINHKKIRIVLTNVFDDVKSYGVVIPSFYHLWGFIIASDKLNDLDIKRGQNLHVERLGFEAIKASFILPKMIEKNIGILK